MEPLVNLTEQRDSLVNEITINKKKLSILNQEIKERVQEKDELETEIFAAKKVLDVLVDITAEKIKSVFIKIKKDLE